MKDPFNLAIPPQLHMHHHHSAHGRKVMVQFKELHLLCYNHRSAFLTHHHPFERVRCLLPWLLHISVKSVLIIDAFQVCYFTRSLIHMYKEWDELHAMNAFCIHI